VGLDTYAAYGKDHHRYDPNPEASNLLPNFLFSENKLCGGMFSGGGNSFRGKVYADWVDFCTGVSLYEEEISSDVVAEMYEDMYRLTNPDNFAEFCNEGFNTYNISFEETQDLLEWFKVVKDEGATIVGWW
jgi:hypothetical protein